MALIKCPECGKQVSDTAPTCPNCGLNFRLKEQIDEIDAKLNRDFEQYVASLKPPVMISSLSELNEYRQQSFQRRVAIPLGICAGIVSLLLTLILFIIGFDYMGFTIHHFLLICLSLALFWFSYYLYNLEKNTLKEKQKQIQYEIDNFDKVKEDRIKSYASILNIRRKNMINNLTGYNNSNNNQNIPHCPTCGSTNIRKISGVSKAGSVAVWGVLAVGKVSKQWHCNNCGSEW